MLFMMRQMFVMVRTYVINFDWEKILDFVGHFTKSINSLNVKVAIIRKPVNEFAEQII